MTPELFEGPKYFRIRTVKQLIERGELDIELRQVARR